MFRFGIKALLLYLLRFSWWRLLERFWRHARARMRIYQALAEHEPYAKARVVLLQLAANEARRAARRAGNLRDLPAPLPEDRDPLGARLWRWALVRCGLRWALTWMDRVEHYDLILAVMVARLIVRVGGRERIYLTRRETHERTERIFRR